MWGGGKWLVQNKVLPGFFHRFLSASKNGIPVSDRGNACIGLELDWGPENQIVTVEAEDFIKDTKKLFGYSYTDSQIRPLREIFLNATTLHYYRLNGGGLKAACPWGIAKYSGTRGNSLKIVIAASVDENGKFDVDTYLGTDKVDTQRVSSLSDVVSNSYVDFRSNVYIDAQSTDEGALEIVAAGTTPEEDEILLTTAQASYVGTSTLEVGGFVKSSTALSADAGNTMSGGTNGTANGTAHQSFLEKAERVSFHCLCCNSSDKTTIALYVAYTRRMCDEVGKVFQCVVPGTSHQIAGDNGEDVAPDNYNIIVVANKVTDEGAPEHAAVYWTVGAQAGVAVNKTVQNAIYNGEYKIDTDHTQTELKNFIKGGKFAFHEAGDEVRVLADINSFVTLTEEEQADFKNNQSVRVFYQQITDISAEFNKNWQGKTPNDQDGRSAFRGVVIKYLKTLEDIRAIQGFDPDTVTIAKGEAKGAVLLNYPTNAVNAMYQLYAAITVE